MKTLCMDTAHKNLVLVLMEDDKIVAGFSHESWKKQSETLFPELMKLMDEVKWSADDLDEVVITDGPGSYTGVRIAMSVAKVLCTTKNIPLYCISSLQLYAGDKEHTMVMLDARSKRAYTGILHHGVYEKDECIMTLDEIQEYLLTHEVSVIGDTDLIGKEVQTIDYIGNFAKLRKQYRRIENVHILVPRYLKDQDSYKV